MELAITLLSLLLALALIVMGLAKVQSLRPSLEVRDRLRMSAASWRLMGAWELVAAALVIMGAFASWQLAVVGALMATVSLLVLLGQQLRRREPLAFLVPAALLVALFVLDVAMLLVHNS